jgi:hypothetical protein
VVVWFGDDTQVLANALDEANKQFAPSNRNILVLVPALRSRVAAQRYQLIKAFLGEQKIVIPVSPSPLDTPQPARLEFLPEGKFLRLWGLTPRFTRVSAVVCVEPRLVDEDAAVYMEHDALVLHNPYASVAASPANFGQCPQFLREGEYLRWSDGRGLMP